MKSKQPADFKWQHFKAKSFCNMYDGTANMELATGTSAY